VKKADIIVIIVLLASIVSLGAAKIQGYDIWFHLKTGEHVLSTFSIPYSDPFSYGVEKMWIAHEWLAGVFYYIVYLVSKLPGLIVFNAALIAFYLFLVFLISRDRAGTAASAAAVFTGALAVRAAERFFIRPDVFTLVLFSSFLFIFHLFRKGRQRAIFAIPPLQLLWANVHGGGSILGIGMLGLFIAGEFAECFFLKKKLPTILLVILAGSILLSFVNPYTWRVPFYFTHTWGSEFGDLLEWRPTNFSDFLGPLGIVLAAAAVTAALFFREISFSELILFAFFLLFSVRAIRLVPFAVIVSCPLAAFGIRKAWQYLASRISISLPRALLPASLALIIALFSAGVIYRDSVTYGSSYLPGFGINEDFYPVDAVEFVDKHGLQGPMFNSYGFGGYLIWRFHPTRKVFVDGRFDAYGEDFIAKYRRFPSKKVWDDLVGRYGFTFTLLDNEPTYICSNLDSMEDWVLVFWNDRSLIYLRDLQQNSELIEKYGYRLLRPNNRDYGYFDEYLGSSGKKDELIAEIMRSFEGGKESLNARLMLGYIYERYDQSEAIRQYEKIVSEIPDWGEIHKRIGLMYLQMRDFSCSLDHLKKAVRLIPGDLDVRNGLSVAYFLKGDRRSAVRECRGVLKIDPGNQTAAINLRLFEGR